MEEEQKNLNQYNRPTGSRPPKGPMRPGVVVVCVICGMIMFLGFWYILFSQFFGNLFGSVAQLNSNTYTQSANVDTVDVFYVEGTISEDSATYNHDWTLNQIDALKDNKHNKGIFLYINSPGGGVYESDELYLKLKQYKEETGRPVYAYMAQTAASGGLYVSMAADKIFANRMTMTGSIGVIMSVTDTTGLQKLIGIKEDKITTGPNKAMGNPLTDEQRQILQSLVDESYDIFVDIVAENRQLDEAKVREIADGRVYSPKQAKELGLIDEIGTYEEAMQDFMETNQLENCMVNTQSAPMSVIQELLSGVDSKLEGGKAVQNFEAIDQYIKQNESPRLMYYME